MQLEIALLICELMWGPQPQRLMNGCAAKPETAMNTFVIIFRQEEPLSPSQLKERAEATRPWAQRVNAQGHALSPRFLAPEEPRGAQREAAPITALLFLEAQDLAQAVEIAASHPATHFGASVEVRAWAKVPFGS